MQIKKIFLLSTLLFIIVALYGIAQKNDKKFIVILDPAGDSKRTGRIIGDSFERGLTLQCAERIKVALEAENALIKVIISRAPGDIVVDLQNASLANRLDADLFISLHFYQADDVKHILSLYQFSYGNDFGVNHCNLALHSYDQAYMVSKDRTHTMAQFFKNQLSSEDNQNKFSVQGPYCLPVKPLIGITCPALLLEAGLKAKDSWHLFVEPFVSVINRLSENFREQP